MALCPTVLKVLTHETLHQSNSTLLPIRYGPQPKTMMRDSLGSCVEAEAEIVNDDQWCWWLVLEWIRPWGFKLKLFEIKACIPVGRVLKENPIPSFCGWLIKQIKGPTSAKYEKIGQWLNPHHITHTTPQKRPATIKYIDPFPSSNFLPSPLVPPPSPTFPLFPHAPGVFFHIKRCWILSLHCFLEELRAWEVGSIQPKPNGNLWKTLSPGVIPTFL